jgi:hypothetical protein
MEPKQVSPTDNSVKWYYPANREIAVRWATITLATANYSRLQKEMITAQPSNLLYVEEAQPINKHVLILSRGSTAN